MKKIISLFLALTMLFSCATAFNVSAIEAGDIADMIYTEESVAASAAALSHFVVEGLPVQFSGSLEEFKKSEHWDDINLMGITLDFLYNSIDPLIWAKLDVFQKDENGKKVTGPDGYPIALITADDVSLMFTNISLYLQNMFYKKYGGLNLYTVENAVSLANVIGNVFYPDFKNLNVNDYKGYFSNETPSTNEFFRAVTRLSGLDVILNQNWVPKHKVYCEDVVNALGGGYMDFFDEYYEDGLILGSKILESMYTKMISVGPVDLILDILEAFASPAYELVYREPTLALFSLKISRLGDNISLNRLYSFDGLLHLIFCDCDPVAVDSDGKNYVPEGCYSKTDDSADHFVPFDFPLRRYSTTESKDEKMIYLYYYLNLCGRYKNNTSYITSVQNAILGSDKYDEGDKTKIIALLDGFILGKFDEETIEKAIVPLYKESITTSYDSIFDRMKNAFMVFLKKIADYFDYLRKLFNGEIQYGQGNSPFN